MPGKINLNSNSFPIASDSIFNTKLDRFDIIKVYLFPYHKGCLYRQQDCIHYRPVFEVGALDFEAPSITAEWIQLEFPGYLIP